MSGNRRLDKIVVTDYTINEEDQERYQQKYDQYHSLTWEEIDSGFVSLVKAAEMMQMARPNYVRLLALTGKLEGVRIAMKGFDKWFIELQSIDAYKNRTGRTLEVRRYLFRCNPKDEHTIRAMLDMLVEEEQISNYELEFAYKGKEDEQK